MSKKEERAPMTFKSTATFTDVMQATSLANKLPVWTKAEVITDDGDGTRTLTAAETNTVFVVDDAALILILPTVSQATIGCKYKIVVGEEETTGLTIKTQGNTHYFSGYAIVTADAAVPQVWEPDGNSNSEINLNGGTTGGKGAGITGDTGIINEMTFTCISGDAGAAWFIEAHLHGDGTIATPFDDQ
tara:strand:- start:131 stop:694 length:564 start_codon:yes stop_codon:yes gene_type:complete